MPRAYRRLLLCLLACGPLGLVRAAETSGELLPDPAVTFGTLANGMRYELLRNATPAGQVALRLRVAAGAVHEGDDELGVAHFLEHMAFRGSRHVADGEAWKILQRLGMQSGADINAVTQPNETVYRFDLPSADEATLDSGLDLLREIASELTIDPRAVDAERAVVLSEERLRDGPALHLGQESLGLWLQGQRAADHLPIGKPETVARLKAETLKRFYRNYYRPERTTLVIVGDVDPAQLERRIRAHFADWRGIGKNPPDPELGKPLVRGPVTRVHSEAGAPSLVTVSWVQPFDAAPETRAHEQHEIIEAVGFMTLAQVFQAIALGNAAPFLQAGASRSRVLRSADVVTLSVQYAGNDWRKALVSADAARRVVLEKGVSQQDVDQAKAQLLSIFQRLADAAGTRSSAAVADQMLQSINEGRVFTSPARDLETVKGDFAGLTAATVNAALREAFKGSGPLILLSSAESVTGGEQSVAAAFESVEKQDLGATPNSGAPIWPYANTGRRGEIAERTTVADLGTTMLRFTNGVRLNVKPTKFQADQVSVLVSVGDGRLELPKDHPTAMWAALSGAVIVGGLDAIDFPTMQRALAGKVYRVNFSLGDLGFELIGETRPADLDTQLQVLAAYLRAPAFRPQVFTQARSVMLAQIRQVQSVPLGLLGVSLGGMMHANDPRWTFPTAAEVEATQPGAVRDLLGNTLRYGPVEVTIVGDVDVDKAIDLVAGTFGMLGPRSSTTLPAGKDIARFPAGGGKPVVLAHQGREDQGVAAIAWPTTDLFAGIQDAAALKVLCGVVQQRLTERLRIAAGASYTTQCADNESITLPGYGFLAATADIQPEKAGLFFDAMKQITADLRAHPVTADELERVQKAEVGKLKVALNTNAMWLGVLSRPQREPRRLDYLRTVLPTLEAVAAPDLQRVARRYLVDDKGYEVIVRKAAAPVVTPAP